MGPRNRFDLDTAIVTWRRFLLVHNRAVTEEDADELEAHLREAVDERMAGRASAEEAFRAAVREMGDLGIITMAYRRVFWHKARAERRLIHEIIARLSMLRNYWKIAVRTLRRHKGYTLINTSGLALGVTCCLLIAFYLQHEFSYDHFHANAERIYRVATNSRVSGTLEEAASSVAPLAPALEAALPEVLGTVRLHPAAAFIERGDSRFQEDGLFFADPTVFEVFSFPLLQGDPATALNDPLGVVLTQEMAQKYFGDENPMGQTLRINGEANATVRGVLAPIPSASHLQFDALIGMPTLEAMEGWLFDNWFSSAFYTYVLVPQVHDAGVLTTQANAVLHQRADPELLRRDPAVSLTLEPLTEIYLASVRTRQAGPTGSLGFLKLLMWVGGFILLIACINFMNLATARSAERAREVGVRKVVGAVQGQLAGQFLSESVLLCAMAVVLAVGLSQLALPAFSAFVGKPLALPAVAWAWYALALTGLSVGLGLAAGSYPALVLSSFRPAQVLKGRGPLRRRGGLLRKGLVVVQFGISIALIAATAIVYTQLDYLRGYNLGFDKEHVLVVSLDGVPAAQYPALKAELLQHPEVIAASASYTTPMGQGIGKWNIEIEGADGTMYETSIPNVPIDYDFLTLYDIEVIAGRGLSEAFPVDATASMLVNEAVVRHLGYGAPEAIIGKRFDTWPQGGQVVGVIRDFNFRSLHNAIEPLTMRYLPEQFATLSVRLQATDVRETVAGLEAAWAALGTGRPFDYQFLDDAFDAQYQADARFGLVFGLFAGLAILIACLGLFGLAAYTAEQRTKEIGIRKVVGASVAQVVLLLSRDFARLVVLGFMIGAPVAYYGMQAWLAGFAYRTPFQPALFAVVGVAALLMACVTVGYQAFRAASVNPVQALRSE